MSLFEPHGRESEIYVRGEKWWGGGTAALLLVSAVMAVIRRRWLESALSAIGVIVLIGLYIRASKLRTFDSWMLFGKVGFALYALSGAFYIITHD
jgi:hypothetical protein